MAQGSERVTVLKRGVVEKLYANAVERSEDPELVQMVEEFRSARAFLRELLVFTDEAARQLGQQVELQARITSLLRSQVSSIPLR